MYRDSDAVLLSRIVEDIAADPILNVTSALRARGIADPTVVRRLQRLWRATGAKRVARARLALEEARGARAAATRTAPKAVRDAAGRFVARASDIGPDRAASVPSMAMDDAPVTSPVPFETLAAVGFAQAVEQAITHWKIFNDAAYGIMSHTFENAALYQRILAHWPTLR